MWDFNELALIYIPKTACTRVVSIFKEHLTNGTRHGKHTGLPAQARKPVVGTIRHPLEWYVSLWSYGFTGNSGVYNTWGSGRDTVYTDVNDVSSFKNWFRALHKGRDCGLMTEWFRTVYMSGGSVIVDHWIRKETLPEDIFRLFEILRIPFDPSELDRMCREYKNATVHLPYKDYYDTELIKEIRDRDSPIFEMFGYEVKTWDISI